MSTVKAANLQNTGSGAPVVKNSSGTEIGQFCKAWVNFNGTGTVAIRDEFNVSSITDNGTGNYTVNFTNNMANTNYCAVTAASSGAQSNVDTWFNPIVYNVGSVQVAGQNASSNNIDRELNNVVVFGD